MRISVSIVTHNTPLEQLQSVVDSLRQDVADRIHIVDNSQEPTLSEFCMENGLEYTHTENRGYGAGHNIAMRKAINDGCDYHLVVNADVRWDGKVLDTLSGIMEADRSIGLVSPRVIYPDGVLQYSARRLPTPFDVFAKRFLPRRLLRKRMDRYLLADADHHKPFSVAYLTGCFLLFRVEALKDVGLFDERFFMYPEDIDISRRMAEKWKVRYSPEAEVVHDHQAASRRNGKMLRVHVKNMIKYFNKWGWLFDKKRHELNIRLQRELPYAVGEPEEGRG